MSIFLGLRAVPQLYLSDRQALQHQVRHSRAILAARVESTNRLRNVLLRVKFPRVIRRALLNQLADSLRFLRPIQYQIVAGDGFQIRANKADLACSRESRPL